MSSGRLQAVACALLLKQAAERGAFFRFGAEGEERVVVHATHKVPRRCGACTDEHRG